MLIVTGHLEVAASGRAAYLAGCVAVVELARRTPGCLEFSLSADLLDPARIVVLERWESPADVAAFRGSGPSDEQAAAIVSASVAQYDVTAGRSLT